MLKKNEMIGRIIANRGDKIIVENMFLDIYELDRFALNRQLFDDLCVFEVPEDLGKQNQEGHKQE